MEGRNVILHSGTYSGLLLGIHRSFWPEPLLVLQLVDKFTRNDTGSELFSHSEDVVEPINFICISNVMTSLIFTIFYNWKCYYYVCHVSD